MEVEAHGQKLTSEFLDQLFVSIINDIPDRTWVEIRKNHDQVIAGIKHIIDMDVYGQDIEIVFNNEFTHFKKRKDEPLQSPIYKGRQIKDRPPAYWTEQDKLRDERIKREWQRAMREQEDKPKRRKHGSKR